MTETHAPNAPLQEAPIQEEQIQKIYVRDLKKGTSLSTVFKASKKERLVSRSGKPYLVINLVDRTGEVDARVFDNLEAAESAFTPGDYLLVTGTVGHYHGSPQIIIERFERIDPEPIDSTEFAWTPPPSPPPPAVQHAPGVHSKADIKGKESKQKHRQQPLAALLNNPQLTEALHVLLQHVERYIDERIAEKQKIHFQRSKHKAKSTKVENTAHEKVENEKVENTAHAHDSAELHPQKPNALPENLTFKPFKELVHASDDAPTSS